MRFPDLAAAPAGIDIDISGSVPSLPLSLSFPDLVSILPVEFLPLFPALVRDPAGLDIPGIIIPSSTVPVEALPIFPDLVRDPAGIDMDIPGIIPASPLPDLVSVIPFELLPIFPDLVRDPPGIGMDIPGIITASPLPDLVSIISTEPFADLAEVDAIGVSKDTAGLSTEFATFADFDSFSPIIGLELFASYEADKDGMLVKHRV